MPFYVNACDELGIEVLPPDVNESQVDFAVVEGKIRFGLNAVKNVGEATLPRDRRGARGGRPVRVDLGLHRARRPVGREQARARVARQVRRARLHRRVADGHARASSSRRSPTARSSSSRPAARPGLDLRPRRRRPADVGARTTPSIPEGEFEKAELLRMEKESLGLYVSEHPLSAIRDQLRRKTDAHARRARAPARRRDRPRRRHRRRRAKRLTTKKGEPMVFVQLEDVTGSVEVVVFNSTYAAARELLRRGRRARRQGPRRPQAAGRDEADRARGRRRSRRCRSGARCGSRSTRAAPRPA